MAALHRMFQRELSFLDLNAGEEEFLEGHQIFWQPFIGVSNLLAIFENFLWAVTFLEYILGSR